MADDAHVERLLRTYRPAEPRPEWIDSLCAAALRPSPPWLDLACAGLLALSVLAGLATDRVEARMGALAPGALGVAPGSERRSLLREHATSIAEMARELGR